MKKFRKTLDIVKNVDPAHIQPRADALEIAIGRQVREFRKSLNLTIVEVAGRAGISHGMLSKIERGVISPSLKTLNTLARSLNVPVTSFFRKYEEEREATYVKAGHGLSIERQGTRAGHQYQLLGHSVRSDFLFDPYLITLKERADVFPLFQHDGAEFIYMLEGEVVYRHADKTYRLLPGDSLFFDADAPHGPEENVKLPIRFISVMVQ